MQSCPRFVLYLHDWHSSASNVAMGFKEVHVCCIFNAGSVLHVYHLHLQVASVTKGVTARGVAAAAGAGLGIGFHGDTATAAKRAELLTQRAHYTSQLQNFSSMRERSQVSVRFKCTRPYSQL